MQFETLKVRQEARKLYAEMRGIYKDTKNFFFRDQILRATLSIGNNIAEGFERETNNELKRFLYIARGSCGEVRSMLHYCLDQKDITQE